MRKLITIAILGILLSACEGQAPVRNCSEHQADILTFYGEPTEMYLSREMSSFSLQLFYYSGYDLITYFEYITNFETGDCAIYETGSEVSD